MSENELSSSGACASAPPALEHARLELARTARARRASTATTRPSSTPSASAARRARWPRRSARTPSRSSWIRRAAPLHDIGKVGDQRQAAAAGRGPFTSEEFAAMQRQARIGARRSSPPQPPVLLGLAARDRAVPPRALGRQRLPAPACRATTSRSPARIVAVAGRLRRAHQRAPVQAGAGPIDDCGRRDRARPAARTSTRVSWPPSSSWTTTPSCRPPGDGPILVEQHLPGVAPAQVAALWWDTGGWPSFVDGFSHVHKRGSWPGPGRRAGLGRAAGVRPRAGDRAGQRARPPRRWGGGDRGRAGSPGRRWCASRRPAAARS